MKLFNIFLSLFAIGILFFLVSLFFPSQYRIEETTVINKPVFESFAYMNEIRNWQDWSPWNRTLDSTFETFYSRNSQGQNATQYFRGDLVGIGRFKISESVPNEKIRYNLSINQGVLTTGATFYFRAAGSKTQLTWLDSGDVGMNPIFRYMLPSKVSSTREAFKEGLNAIKRSIEKY